MFKLRSPIIKMSSRYTAACRVPCNKVSIVLWKIAGLDTTPNTRWLYLNSPLCVLMMTYCFDSSCSNNCWYAWLISSLVKSFPSDKVANKSSTLGEGYSSSLELIHCKLVIATHLGCFVASSSSSTSFIISGPGLEKAWCRTQINVKLHYYAIQCSKLIFENILVRMFSIV